jgi:AcrR family transcriptional regulator
MTVYYQFGSKIGLLEALSDDLATRGEMERLPEAFQQPDPLDALLLFIALFGRFWASDRLVTRRLRGLATVDPDFEHVIRGRDERRRTGLRVIVWRLSERRGTPAPEDVDAVVAILHTLTSFESFDTLAGADRGPEDVVPLVQQLARATLEMKVGG